jgi:hypothetical protein
LNGRLLVHHHVTTFYLCLAFLASAQLLIYTTHT